MKKGFIQRHLPRVIFTEIFDDSKILNISFILRKNSQPEKIVRNTFCNVTSNKSNLSHINIKCNEDQLLYKEYSPEDWPVQF